MQSEKKNPRITFIHCYIMVNYFNNSLSYGPQNTATVGIALTADILVNLCQTRHRKI